MQVQPLKEQNSRLEENFSLQKSSMFCHWVPPDLAEKFSLKSFKKVEKKIKSSLNLDQISITLHTASHPGKPEHA